MKSAQGYWRVGKYKCSIMWKFFLSKTCGICMRLPSYWFGLNWFVVLAQKIHFFFTLAVPAVDYKSINWRELCVHQGTWLSIFKWSNLCCWCLSMISNIMSLQSLADLTQVARTLQDKSASYLIFHHYTWYPLNVKQL